MPLGWASGPRCNPSVLSEARRSACGSSARLGSAAWACETACLHPCLQTEHMALCITCGILGQLLFIVFKLMSITHK